MKPYETMSKEEIEKKMENVNSVEDVVGVLKEVGVETTEEEMIALVKKEQESELSDESLEEVAGGFFRPIVYPIPVGIGIGAILKLIKQGKLPKWFKL